MRSRHSRRRGNSIVELMAAISFAVVLFPAVFPPIGPALLRTGELYEQEAARLLLEGELARARDDAGRGLLAVGVQERTTRDWKSAERFDSLVVTRRVSKGAPGLLDVAVEARWRSRARPGRPVEKASLATWVATR